MRVQLLCRLISLPEYKNASYDKSNCNTEAINLGYYALLSFLNPFPVFDFLMNLKRFMWQVAREAD